MAALLVLIVSCVAEVGIGSITLVIQVRRHAAVLHIVVIVLVKVTPLYRVCQILKHIVSASASSVCPLSKRGA